jgi:glutaredoxin
MPNPPPAEGPSITLYALQTCGHCKSVKALLKDCQVSFQVVYVDMLTGEERNDTMRLIRRLNPSVAFPMLVIGKTVIVGFKKKAIEAALALRPSS